MKAWPLFLMACACAAPIAARAQSFFRIEAGLGVTSATKLGNGMYYSEGFAHSTPNGSYGGRVALVMDALPAKPRSLVPGVHVNLAYQNFGKVRWSSMNPQDAADFDGKGGYDSQGGCIDDKCGTMRKFDSTGGIQSLSLTVEPYWDLGNGWTVGVEAGPALFRANWTSVATAMDDDPRFGPKGTQEVLSNRKSLQVGALAGASVSQGPFVVRLNYLYAPVKFSPNPKEVPAGIKGEWMLSLNYRW